MCLSVGMVWPDHDCSVGLQVCCLIPVHSDIQEDEDWIAQIEGCAEVSPCSLGFHAVPTALV